MVISEQMQRLLESGMDSDVPREVQPLVDELRDAALQVQLGLQAYLHVMRKLEKLADVHDEYPPRVKEIVARGLKTGATDEKRWNAIADDGFSIRLAFENAAYYAKTGKKF